MALKVVFLLMLITITCLNMVNNATTHATRVLPTIMNKPGFDLARRLEESGGGVTECWNALMEFKSCSTEIIVFFLNGQTDIGPGCCDAISIITRHCWSYMLTSLGYTIEEGNILIGYCNATSSSASPVASPPLVGSLPVNSSLSPSMAHHVSVNV